MKRFIFPVILFLMLSGVSYAAGSFSVGLVAGVSGDGGSVSKTAGNLNCDMRRIKASAPATDVDELPVYYTPALSAILSYYYDRMMLRLGWEYASTPFYNEKGSIDPPGNEVELEYYRFTFPLSAGLVIPAGSSGRFYFSGGVNLTYAVIEITQSNPGTFPTLPDHKSTFSGYLPGFHLKIGAEAVLSGNYSLLVEYTRYMGKFKKVESDNENASIHMGLDTFEISAGLNYKVNLGN